MKRQQNKNNAIIAMGKAMDLKIVDEGIETQDQLNKKTDIIAVGVTGRAPQILNWYTDYSFVYFAPDTVGKLLNENKLQWAFNQFGVTKIVGYDKNTTEQILKNTNVRNIDIYEK